MEKKTYCVPEMRCIEIDVKDIIATSPNTDNTPIGGDGTEEPD